MTEEKTCYNCANPNCHIPLNSVRINVEEHHETYDWDMKFDCMNHDKWEELKVEKIRTDNTEIFWKNKKTGNLYVVIYDEAIECTNGREDIDYTVYTSINDVKDMNSKIFVRQTSEFYQKFERITL